jgi:hypothetical protein
MSYTINLTDGTIFAVVADGTVNTDSSMTLVGKNYAGYGEFLDENFIHLLENGSNTTAPTAPLEGQLWWNQTAGTLNVYNGSSFVVVSGAAASSSAPTSPVAGDLWYDSTNAQLRVYTGATWLLVGPAFTSGQGETGAIVNTITDNTAVSHVVIELYVEDSVVAIVSKDATFTPATPIAGFTTVRPGITLATTVSGVTQLFQGTATNAQLLDNLDSTDFLSAVANDTTTGTLGVLNDTGLSVGVDSDARISVSGNDVLVFNNTSGGNLVLRANVGGTVTTKVTMWGGNNMTTISGPITVNAAANTTAIVNGAGNAVGNIGSSSSYFNQVFAVATTALYADVAERFAADDLLEPGTVVELGGAREITRSLKDLSENVFGVISTRPAYTMNGGAGEDDTHPKVAMTGRVPVKVTGVIHKGDRLVSAGNGIARAAAQGEATAFNVIGRALVDKLTDGLGTVEAIVTIK